MGDEATEAVAEPSVSIAKVARVPADTTMDLVDPSAISSPRVEVATDDTPAPEVDVGTPFVHTNPQSMLLRRLLMKAIPMTYNSNGR